MANPHVPNGPAVPLHLGEQPEHDRSRRLVLLKIDQELAEGPGLRVTPELADPLNPDRLSRPGSTSPAALGAATGWMCCPRHHLSAVNYRVWRLKVAMQEVYDISREGRGGSL
jgi:hypothetical protein